MSVGVVASVGVVVARVGAKVVSSEVAGSEVVGAEVVGVGLVCGGGGCSLASASTARPARAPPRRAARACRKYWEPLGMGRLGKLPARGLREKCCAQFLVHRNRVQRHPKEFYEVQRQEMTDPGKTYLRCVPAPVPGALCPAPCLSSVNFAVAAYRTVFWKERADVQRPQSRVGIETDAHTCECPSGCRLTKRSTSGGLLTIEGRRVAGH